MNSDSNIVPLKVALGQELSSSGGEQLEPISDSVTRRMSAPLIQLREKSQRELMKRMQLMFDKIDDALFEIAERAISNTEKTDYFESMREIRLKRLEIEGSFVDAYKQGYRILLQNTGAGRAGSQSSCSLSVMADEAVE